MTPYPDNAPGGEDHEDYQRGDLSGIVMDLFDGMVKVRFVGDHEGQIMSCRLVVKADGTIGIDPSGLPKVRQRRLPEPRTQEYEPIQGGPIVELPAGDITEEP